MARSLMPPMFDATIWQWPVTSFNPGDVNMYMFMLEQQLPGKGKRDLRAAAVQPGRPIGWRPTPPCRTRTVDRRHRSVCGAQGRRT